MHYTNIEKMFNKNDRNQSKHKLYLEFDKIETISQLYIKTSAISS